MFAAAWASSFLLPVIVLSAGSILLGIDFHDQGTLGGGLLFSSFLLWYIQYTLLKNTPVFPVYRMVAVWFGILGIVGLTANLLQ